MAAVRVATVPVDRVPGAAAIDPPAWVRRLPRGLVLAFVSVLIPGHASRLL